MSSAVPLFRWVLQCCCWAGAFEHFRKAYHGEVSARNGCRGAMFIQDRKLYPGIEQITLSTTIDILRVAFASHALSISRCATMYRSPRILLCPLPLLNSPNHALNTETKHPLPPSCTTSRPSAPSVAHLLDCGPAAARLSVRCWQALTDELVGGLAYLGVVICAASGDSEEACVAIGADVGVGAGSRFQCVKGLRASARARARRRVRRKL